MKRAAIVLGLLSSVSSGCCSFRLGGAYLALIDPERGAFSVAVDGDVAVGVMIFLEPYTTLIWQQEARQEGRHFRVHMAPALQDQRANDGPLVFNGEEFVVHLSGTGNHGFGYYVATNSPQRYRVVNGTLVKVDGATNPFSIRFRSREERASALREIDKEFNGQEGRISEFHRIIKDPMAAESQKRTASAMLYWSLAHAGILEESQRRAVHELLPAIMKPGLRGQSVAGLLAESGVTQKALHYAYRDLRSSSSIALGSYVKDVYDLSDLSPLVDCVNLTTLSIRNANIKNIAPIGRLENLTELQLEGNCIEDIGPLSKLKNLEVLGLRGNRIFDIGPLKRCKSLFSIDLSCNSIEDIAPLVELFEGTRTSTVGYHAYIYLKGNPIRDRGLVQVLSDSGVKVN